ncbi:MAG: hypothetical protein ACOYBS_00640 [Flavobacterium sp.]
MVPNKLETKINEQINAREIQPSPTAWDRLDAMLTLAEDKKTKRIAFLSYKNIGIAASILLLVSLGLFYFSPKENTVVIGNDNVNNNDNISVSSKQEEHVVEATNNKPTINQELQPTTHNPQPIVNPLIIQDKEIEFQSNEVIAQNQLPRIEFSKEIRVSNSIKVNAVNLLAAVDTPIKINTSPKIKVNANSLLSQVDGELDQTFREKALNQISKNYKEIKVALETRNQE